MKFIPDNFEPPLQFSKEMFCFHKLCAKDAYEDYIAVMSNRELILKTRGGTWPQSDLSFEDNLIDLAWHQREFDFRRSFAYCIMSQDQKYLGCVYLYPPNTRKPAPNSTDVDVSFWVVKEAYDAGVYFKLFHVIHLWIKSAWPFKFPFWTNIFLPEQSKAIF